MKEIKLKCQPVEGYGVVKEERGPGFKFGIMMPCTMPGWPDREKLLQTSIHVMTTDESKVIMLREMLLKYDLEMLGRSHYDDGDRIAIKKDGKVVLEYDTADLRGSSGTQIDYLLKLFMDLEPEPSDTERSKREWVDDGDGVTTQRFRDESKAIREGNTGPDADDTPKHS